MPSPRTLLTEIVTALGMLDSHVEQAPPSALRHVSETDWEALQHASSDPKNSELLDTAWSNGRVFLESSEALRGRVPVLVEWKGRHKPPGYEYIPADLRVDHVYLISCKYNSEILLNPSPAHLFDRCLESRHGHARIDWYHAMAEEEYRHLYEVARRQVGTTSLPNDPCELSDQQRKLIQIALPGRWKDHDTLSDAYLEFCAAVSHASARHWKARLRSKGRQESMAWRLLRLADAPYFLLGARSNSKPVRVRVGTPWDWRYRYKFSHLDIQARRAGQPLVCWAASATDRHTGQDVSVEGHIEIRWSHGKFGGVPEAKVYLDTPHDQVPGYVPLV